jgi:hypothetical protein
LFNRVVTPLNEKNIFILSNKCPLTDARLIKQAFALKENKFNVFLFGTAPPHTPTKKRKMKK